MNGRPRDTQAGDDTYDARIARLYRDAAREEPPAHLDERLLAAARQEAGVRPRSREEGASSSSGATRKAKLPWRPGWPIPVAVAAVVVLSVSVHVLRPDDRLTKLDAPPASEATGMLPRSEPSSLDAESGAPTVTEKAPQAIKQEAMRDNPRPDIGVPRRESETGFGRFETGRAGAPAARNGPASRLAHEPPGKWGEEIMRLRRSGQAREADALLAEFRERFPGYAIPPEWTR